MATSALTRKNLGEGAATCSPPTAILDMTATNHGTTKQRNAAITIAQIFLNVVLRTIAPDAMHFVTPG